MSKLTLVCLLGLSLVVVFSGCTVRTYPLTRERVDQELSQGNRGYLSGTAPEVEGDRSTTRTVQIVEVELGRQIKIKERPQSTQIEELPEEYGVSESALAEIAGPQASFEAYTVQKGDTLQKISQKFFGTTKKWYKIYEANRDTLKSPDRVYPGQTLNIPMAPTGGKIK